MENTTNYEKIYALLEKADALRYDGIVISDWSLTAEKVQEVLEESDDENPIVLSMYHIDFDFQKSDFYFDLSDVNDGVLDDNMKLTAADGHILEILFAIRAEVKQEAVEVVKPEPSEVGASFFLTDKG